MISGDGGPRRIGVRPHGVYWGGGGENIDVRSGNLNVTLPMLQPVGRAGFGATFALSYAITRKSGATPGNADSDEENQGILGSRVWGVGA